MALPLVLSFVDAFLALSAVLIGLGASSTRDQRPEALRVVAAAQRAALDLLTQAAPFGALSLVLFLASGSIAAALGGTAARDLVWAGLGGALVAAGSAWLSGWQVARATACLNAATSLETAAARLGRLTSSTLLLGVAAGSGLSAVCFAGMPTTAVQGALTGAVAGVGLLVVLARPGVLAWAAASQIRGNAPLHPGSLAALVGTTYLGTWLLHASLFAAAAIGHIALFSLARGAADGLGTYALLLPRIGLFALACGGLGSRSSGHEQARAVWLRKVVIALVVLAGGAWTVRGVLALAPVRTWAPALVCYLCVAFGVSAWILTTQAKRESSFASPLALLPVLLLVLVATPKALATHSSTVLLLVVASTLALLPLAAVFRATSAAMSSAVTCELLALGTADPRESDADSASAPSLGQQELFLPLASLVVVCAAAYFLEQAFRGAFSTAVDPLVFGLGALTSALLLRALSRSLKARGRAGSARLAELSGKQQEDGGLLLGEGLAVLRRVGGGAQPAFALAVLGPPLTLTAYASTGSPAAFMLIAGSLVGALFWAVLADPQTSPDRPEAAHAALVWPLALHHLAWCALLLTSRP